MTALFDGAVAVVTGGAGGIGQALAEELLARGARHVVMADIDAGRAEAAARAAGARAARLDVTDEAAVAHLVQEVEDGTGPIDFWFSNAGVGTDTGLGTPGEWRLALDVNLVAHVHAARHVLPRMEQRGQGHFVITASAAGLLSDTRTAAYTATKHAAVGLAEWLAITVGDGVRIACICPERVRTSMTSGGSERVAGTTIDAPAAAGHALDGIARGEFLVLTHPRTAEFAQRRALDRPRWLRGMRELHRRQRAPAPA